MEPAMKPVARLVAALLACALVLAAASLPAAAAPTVLVTGANRGIGFELARQYAARGWTVIATAREPRGADALQALARGNGNLRVEKLDVTSDRSVQRLAKKYRGQPIDVLVNNAGILGDVPAQKLGSYDFEVFDEIMEVSVKGPLRVTQAFIDNVAARDQKKVVNISSAVGSIKLTFPGQVFYRSSKAALNMATRTLSREVKLPGPDPRRKEIVFGLVNPGIVDTGFAKNVPVPMIQAEESARYVIERIDGLTKENTGAFLDYKGSELPW